MTSQHSPPAALAQTYQFWSVCHNLAAHQDTAPLPQHTSGEMSAGRG